MSIGLFYLIGILSFVFGMYLVRFNKRVGILLFVTAITTLTIGSKMFFDEKNLEKQIVESFKSGKTLTCKGVGKISLEDGWELVGDDHFIKDEMITKALYCKD